MANNTLATVTSLDAATNQQEVDRLRLVDPKWLNSVPYHYAKRHQLLVSHEVDGEILVIHSNSFQINTLTELKRQLNRSILLEQLDEEEFNHLLRQAYDKGQSAAAQMVEDIDEEVDFALLAQELPETMDLLEASDDAPIVRLINSLLTQSIREDASDIHLEAFEDRSVVRFRVDGLLRDVIETKRQLHSALVSRIKVMAKLDIAEKRLPQDGRISLRVGDHSIDVRVSVLPTQHGERVVLRILDKSSSRFDLLELGMTEKIRTQFDSIIRTPHGIVLITGPTGSGKTTTLYAGLSKIDRKRLNVLTVEDPIEYDLDGVGQTQVNSKIDLTFAAGLRSILRQDPDVVLVGEIRDVETAQIAIQSSLTGHLVLSTLHTNTAIGAVTRLIDMGVESFLIASSLTAILSQRLVRRLCENCREEYYPSNTELKKFKLKASIRTYRSAGCSECSHTGFRGRVGIYELIKVDETLRTLIHDNASEDIMLQHVRQTVPSITENGLDKVKQGETSLSELTRVTLEL